MADSLSLRDKVKFYAASAALTVASVFLGKSIKDIVVPQSLDTGKFVTSPILESKTPTDDVYHPTEERQKTYVLVGAVMEGHVPYIPKDIIILSHKEYPSIDSAAAQIKGSAKVILLAHGGQNGTFSWQENQSLPYSELLGLLPEEGIESVTVNSCYGGTINHDRGLIFAPTGTIVQSVTGSKTINWSGTDIGLLKEMNKQKMGLTGLLLEVLDNFDPQSFENATIEFNTSFKAQLNANPVDAVPHVIGLGGTPLIRIDWAVELERLAAAGEATAYADSTNWNKSIERVKNAFDGQGLWNVADPRQKEALDKKITMIATKIRNGESLTGKNNVETADNLRIAYALAAANLEESGLLKAIMEYQKVESTAATISVSPASMEKRRIHDHALSALYSESIGKDDLAKIDQELAQKGIVKLATEHAFYTHFLPKNPAVSATREL